MFSHAKVWSGVSPSFSAAAHPSELLGTGRSCHCPEASTKSCPTDRALATPGLGGPVWPCVAGAAPCTGRCSAASVPLPPTRHSAPHLPAHPELWQPGTQTPPDTPAEQRRADTPARLSDALPPSSLGGLPKTSRGDAQTETWGAAPDPLLPPGRTKLRAHVHEGHWAAFRRHTQTGSGLTHGPEWVAQGPKECPMHQAALPSGGPAPAPSPQPRALHAPGSRRPRARALSLVSAPADRPGLCPQTQRPEPCLGHRARAEGPGPPRLSHGVYSYGRDEGSPDQPCEHARQLPTPRNPPLRRRSAKDHHACPRPRDAGSKDNSPCTRLSEPWGLASQAGRLETCPRSVQGGRVDNRQCVARFWDSLWSLWSEKAPWTG